RKGISTMYGHHVTSLDGNAKEVEITNVETGATTTMGFDFLHITPPQCPPDIVSESVLADQNGWVEVDKYTTQSQKYPNVFSLGDASSLPTSKTAAAVRKQAPVLVNNLLREIRGTGTQRKYDGYSSCPLVTGYRKTLIAEFDYEGRPTPTIPGLDPRKERFMNYLIKAYGLPMMYWNLMLKGLM
ncbi:MAG: NAD(P)/FAD-dependent oxidoreductase, partial [Candidatus Eremiobacteraeota bacterium]|nr:NAD(P)/FAD-dependent oxidoreductase [Candidatus Eremiobacteraeota bacterium]